MWFGGSESRPSVNLSGFSNRSTLKDTLNSGHRCVTVRLIGSGKASYHVVLCRRSQHTTEGNDRAQADQIEIEGRGDALQASAIGKIRNVERRFIAYVDVEAVERSRDGKGEQRSTTISTLPFRGFQIRIRVRSEIDLFRLARFLLGCLSLPFFLRSRRDKSAAVWA